MNNIILIGFMGSGKTTVGETLAKMIGWKFADTDQMIEEQQQRSINSIFEQFGEAAFRKMETELICQLTHKSEQHIFSVGGGLPVQPQNVKPLKRLGCVIYLKASKETILKRLAGDTTRPLLAGGKMEKKITELMLARELAYETAADAVLQTDQLTITQTAEAVHALVQNRIK